MHSLNAEPDYSVRFLCSLHSAEYNEVPSWNSIVAPYVDSITIAKIGAEGEVNQRE